MLINDIDDIQNNQENIDLNQTIPIVPLVTDLNQTNDNQGNINPDQAVPIVTDLKQINDNKNDNDGQIKFNDKNVDFVDMISKRPMMIVNKNKKKTGIDRSSFIENIEIKKN